MSDYNVFTIVDASHDDDTIYPVLSAPNEVYPVELTGEDGQVSHLTATKALVQQETTKGGLMSVLPLPTDVKWDILITDTRVIFYCTKYDKGGGWTGMGAGALLAVAANAVSKARAAHRRKGRVLVGQLRYPWVVRIGGSPKEGWRSAENLRIKVDAQPGGNGHRYIYVTLVLPRQADAASIAHEVVTRCARYRLKHDPQMDGAERQDFKAMVACPKKVPSPSKPGSPAWAWYPMPTSYRVNAKTARPLPRESSSASGSETGA